MADTQPDETEEGQPADAAQRHCDRMAKRSRQQHKAAAEIGEIPAVANPGRKQLCRLDPVLFLAWYFPHSAGLKPLSPDHHLVVDYISRCILIGGLFAQAIYRGFAKTTLGTLLCLWAMLYGHRRYAVMFGWDKPAAIDLLDDIKTELLENDRLYDDFPEVCHPLRLIDGNPLRARNQTYKGEKTHARWTPDKIVLPTIPGAAGGGAIIQARPRANARGLRHTMPDGTKQRPDWFLGDDIQNDEAAASPRIVAKTLKVIYKSWLLLCGHHHGIAGVVNGTIGEPDDVMDQLTNAELKEHAAWQSQRIRLVHRWADRHEDLWLTKYADLRTSFSSDLPGDQERAHAEATAFYFANRKAMDAGCVVSWVHCYRQAEGEVSAIQHAYNQLIDLGEEAFEAECQQNPRRDDGDIDQLPAEELRRKQHHLGRRVVPRDAAKVTAFIDQQDKLLYYMVVAWGEGFTGYVVDYGTYPDQKRSYFTLANALRTLKRAFRGRDDEGALFAGLEKLTDWLMTREFRREGGGTVRIDRAAIDTNYGKRSDLIRRFIRQSPHRASLRAWFGRAIKGRNNPISQWPQRDGRIRGVEWVDDLPEGDSVRQLIADTWYWKKRATDALALSVGSKGCLTLFKAAAAVHRMVVDHLRSNRAHKTRDEDSGATWFEWSKPPGVEDHWFDCLVGCMVVASTIGVRRPEDKPPPKSKRRKKVQYL